MATSSLGYYTRFTESLADDEDPTSGGRMYYAANNVNHLADQYSQHRVNWMIKSGAQGLQLDPDDTLDTTNKFFMYKSGTFDLHVKTSGSSYSAGCWIYCQSGHAGTQAVFYAALVPAGDAEPERALVEVNTASTNVATCNRTSTSYAWEKVAGLVYLDAPRVARAQQACSTVDSIGGSTVGVVKLAVRLWIYTSVSTVSGNPQIGGVRLVEYLAP